MWYHSATFGCDKSEYILPAHFFSFFSDNWVLVVYSDYDTLIKSPDCLVASCGSKKKYIFTQAPQPLKALQNHVHLEFPRKIDRSCIWNRCHLFVFKKLMLAAGVLRFTSLQFYSLWSVKKNKKALLAALCCPCSLHSTYVRSITFLPC